MTEGAAGEKAGLRGLKGDDDDDEDLGEVVRNVDINNIYAACKIKQLT